MLPHCLLMAMFNLPVAVHKKGTKKVCSQVVSFVIYDSVSFLITLGKYDVTTMINNIWEFHQFSFNAQRQGVVRSRACSP